MVDQQGMSARMCMQSFVALQALGIFRELILRTRTTTVAFWDPPSWSNKRCLHFVVSQIFSVSAHAVWNSLSYKCRELLSYSTVLIVFKKPKSLTSPTVVQTEHKHLTQTVSLRL